MYRRIEHRSNQSVLWKDRTVWICKTKIGRDARGSRHDLVYMTCPTTTKSKISFEKKSMVRTYGRWSTTLFALIHFLRNDWRVHANAAIPNKFNNPGRIVQAIVCVCMCFARHLSWWVVRNALLHLSYLFAANDVLVLEGVLIDDCMIFLNDDDSVMSSSFFW